MGWLNNAAGAVWRAGHRATTLFRPRAANETRDYADLEALLRSVTGEGMSTSGVYVSQDSASRFAAVAACERVLTNDVAQLPLVLYRRTGDQRTPAVQDPLYRLLHDRPNEWQTSFEWRKLKQRDLMFRGAAYSMIVRGVGARVQELLRLHPDKVKPKQDDRTLEVSYEYTRRDGRRVMLTARDVFVLRGPSDDGVTPLTPVQLFRETIGDGIALREHGSRFFSNGAKPLGVLHYEGEMSKTARQAFRDDWDEVYKGGANAHKTLLLPDGTKYTPVTITMEDAQYLEARKFNRSEICGIYGVPPHRVGDLDRATFSNIEHQHLAYVTNDLTPHLVNWEQALARDLLDNDPARYFKFNVDAFLRGDSKSRAEALQIRRRNGIISANEWRELDDMNPRPDPGGDEYIVERNMGAQTGSNNEGNPPT